MRIVFQFILSEKISGFERAKQKVFLENVFLAEQVKIFAQAHDQVMNREDYAAGPVARCERRNDVKYRAITLFFLFTTMHARSC